MMMKRNACCSINALIYLNLTAVRLKPGWTHLSYLPVFHVSC